MKKIKIKLNKATKLKNALEQSIEQDNSLITKWNEIIKGNNREVDIREIENLKDYKSEFLIELNLSIQEANFKKDKDETKSNAYYIKRLSELQRQKSFYQKLETRNGTFVIEKKMTVVYESLITSTDVTSQIKNLDKEINNLQNKLSTFNETHEITISYDPLLNDIIESVGIEV